MVAYGKLLRELGYTVTFILDDGYLHFPDFSTVGKPVSCTGLKLCEFEVAIFCNSAPRNPQVAARMRASATTVLYLYHEPISVWDWKSLGQEGWKQIVRFPFSAYFSARLLLQSSAAIVPSAFARKQYQRNYSHYNRKVFELPLLFEDEVDAINAGLRTGEKKYFGFIGSASRGHGFDKFVAFAKYAIRRGSTIPFVIATRRSISRLLRTDEELASYAQEGRIQIEHGRVFSNEEINRYYLDSFCVWNVYRRSTQSGVLPRSFMAGTPVLASRIGSFPEFIREGVTGEFVESPDDLSEILDLAESIRSRYRTYAEGCRSAFLTTFYYKANISRLAEIINETRPQFIPKTRVSPHKESR